MKDAVEGLDVAVASAVTFPVDSLEVFATFELAENAVAVKDEPHLPDSLEDESDLSRLRIPARSDTSRPCGGFELST